MHQYGAICRGQLLAVADVLYERAEHGIARLPRDCRPAIHAARLVYAEIGRELERAGLDSVNRRAVVSGWRKLALLVRASAAVLIAPADPARRIPPLAANEFLVTAVGRSAARAASRSPPMMARSFDERMGWAADLFGRLSQQDQERNHYRSANPTQAGR